jgi:hypothetical protein
MSHMGPGGPRNASLILCSVVTTTGAAWEDVSSWILIQSQESRRKSSRLRTVSAKFVHGHHLQDQILIVSPDNCQIYRNVNTVAGSLALPVGVAAVAKRRDRRSSQSISASVLVEYSLVHCIWEHYPTPQLQHRQPAPIGKMAVSDGLCLCSCFISGHRRAVNGNSKVNCSGLPTSVARQSVYSAIATVLLSSRVGCVAYGQHPRRGDWDVPTA